MQGGLSTLSLSGGLDGAYDGLTSGLATGGVLGALLHQVCFVAGTRVVVGIEDEDGRDLPAAAARRGAAEGGGGGSVATLPRAVYKTSRGTGSLLAVGRGHY